MPLRLLKKYAVNLLKPPDERPTSWRSIQFYSKLIQEKVGFLNGSKQILMQLGYTENMLNQHQQVVGLKFPDSVQEPNRERVLQLANDLTIAAFEIVEIANESHPKLEMLFRTGQVCLLTVTFMDQITRDNQGLIIGNVATTTITV